MYHYIDKCNDVTNRTTVRLTECLFNDYFSNTGVMYLPLRWEMITNDGFVRVWNELDAVDVSASPVQSFVRLQCGRLLEISDVLARDGEETGITSLQVWNVKPYRFTESAESDLRYKGSSVQATWRNSIAWACCAPFMHNTHFWAVVLLWRYFKHSKPKPQHTNAIKIYLWRGRYSYLAMQWAPCNRR
jgi:hypothetical protein